MRIYLFRHGETEWNRQMRLQGQRDIPLNEAGRELAVKTAGALKEIPFDRAFCSPLRRAAETAEILLGDRAVPLVRDDRLKEICFGEYEGESFDKEKKQDFTHPLYHFFYDTELYVPPAGAESFQDIIERGRSFLQEQIVPLEGDSQHVLIVAHDALNRGILTAIGEICLADFWRSSLPNCGATILSLENGSFRILEESHVYSLGQ